jgi:hypothetical protein
MELLFHRTNRRQNIMDSVLQILIREVPHNHPGRMASLLGRELSRHEIFLKDGPPLSLDIRAHWLEESVSV